MNLLDSFAELTPPSYDTSPTDGILAFFIFFLIGLIIIALIIAIGVLIDKIKKRKNPPQRDNQTPKQSEIEKANPPENIIDSELEN